MKAKQKKMVYGYSTCGRISREARMATWILCFCIMRTLSYPIPKNIYWYIF